jgi:hypothetical protein
LWREEISNHIIEGEKKKKKIGEGTGILAWKVVQKKRQQVLSFLYKCVCKAHNDHQKFVRLGLI